MDELRELVVRIQSARTRQHPYLRAFQQLGLLAERRLGATKGGAVGAQADEGDGARAVASNLGRKSAAPGEELGIGQLVRGRGAAIHQIGESVAQLEQPAVFGRIEATRGKPGGMQRGPETVAGSREVKPGGGGVKPGVDAAEQDLEVRADYVAQPLARGRAQILRARPA